MLEARAASQAIQHALSVKGMTNSSRYPGCVFACKLEPMRPTPSSMDAIHTFGGYGYSRECEVEGDRRDTIGGTLNSGTSDMQRNIIASQLGVLR